MDYYGPLAKFSTMKYERKHAEMKRIIKTSSNFKNVAKTLAFGHQDFQVFNKKKTPASSSNMTQMDVKDHPFPLDNFVMRAIINKPNYFLAPLAFFSIGDRIFVRGALKRVIKSLRPTIWEYQEVGKADIQLECLSHVNSFSFTSPQGFLLNYVANK